MCTEYIINQSIIPTLLFPLEETPFSQYREFYPTYSSIYQIGVFISRTSIPFFRIRSLYKPTVYQCFIFALFLKQSLSWNVIPNIWFVFVIMFFDGLVSGMVSVNTFCRIVEEVQSEKIEFGVQATLAVNTGSILLAGIVGMMLEPMLCQKQVDKGRDWCRRR